MSASLISPSSFEVFGRQVQHQTSTHAGNILSSYGNPCKLDPCPSVCYLYVLTKEQGKGKWALPKKTCEGFWRLFGKGRMFGRPFFKTNPEELSTLCIYPKQLLNKTKKESINKTLFISTLAQYFILQLMRNIPWTTMTSIELRLLNTCCITQKVRCWGGNNQKDIAKEQGHGRKTYKVFSLTRFYQFGEDNWNIMFKQILRCYVLVLTKEQGKGKWALPKSLRRLLTTIWQTLFQNKSWGTINPAYLPLELLNNTKNVSINKLLSITNFAHDFYPTALKEHQMNNYDPDRVLFWKSCNGKKCITSYTGLGEASSWALALEPIHAMTYGCYTCYKLSIYSEKNCGRYADRCSPFGVGAPKWLWSGFQYHLAGCKARKLYGITVVNNTENRT